MKQKEFDFGIYRFVPPRPDIGWVSLDIGMMDDLQVVRFHAKEKMGPYTFRWTRDASYVSVIGVQENSALAVFWLNDGGRPPTIPPAEITVYLNNNELGRAIVGHEFRPYTFAIPRALAAAAAHTDEPAQFRLVTNTWNPREILGRPDDRQLGVMVDRVEVK